MAKNSYLSRHEELRYNYLLKNLSFLSAREREEFDYLDQKKKGYFAPTPNQQPQPQQSYQSDDYWADEASRQTYDPDYWADEKPSLVAEDQDAYYDRLQTYERPTTRRANQRRERQALYSDPVNPTVQQVPQPRQKPRRRRKIRWKRIFTCLGALLLLLVALMGYNVYKGYRSVTASNSNYSPAVKEVFHGEDTEDGTNILILGSDQRVTQGATDARTDTIMVVNVGNKEGKIKMVSFMRDTLVNIEDVSDTTTDPDVKLNTAFTIGEQNNNQGAELMRQTLKRNFGIKIKYYALVDFQTFAEAIDTLFPNGVDIDAQFSTVDGQVVSSVEVPDDLNAANGVTPNQTISVGKQKMDGRTLLNYARFRKDDEGDYGRTKRQQQVMQAIMTQIKNPTKLFTGSEAIGKVFGLTSTNLPYTFLLTHGVSLIKDASNGIEQTTIPANGDWVDVYDKYGGAALYIDRESYKAKLKEMGLE